MSSKQFVVYWCNEGLESVLPVTDIEMQATFNILANKPVPASVNQTLNMMVLRARYNLQRHYEIYAIEAVDGIDEDDIRGMFEDDPQMAADTIRRIGHKIYSDRLDPSAKHIKIT